MWRFWQRVPQTEEEDVERPHPVPAAQSPGYGINHHHRWADEASEDDNGHSQAQVPSVLFTLVFILIVFNALPPGFGLFLFASLILYSCLRAARLQAQQAVLQEAERQQLMSRQLAQGQEMAVRQPGSVLQLLQSGGQVMVVGRSGVRPLRLQGDGDLPHASTAADLEALIMSTLAQQMAAMQRGGAPGAGPSSSVPPVTDEDMAVLPTFTYKRPATVTGEASQPSPSTSKEGATDAAGSQGAEQPAGNSNSSTPAARTSEAGSEGDMLTCPICIEAVEDGDEVLTLPCLHQFHSTCVSPWLKQQGRVQAKCPMCKTPVWQ